MSEKKVLKLWTQGPMVRIFPHDPVPQPARKQIAISAARGECECSQIGVHTAGFAVNSLTAEAGDLSGPRGSRIPAANIDILYPEYVPAKWPTAGQDASDVERPAPAFYPDPLMPDWNLNVCGPEAAPTKVVWVRVRVPRDAKPGTYRGTIAVRASHRDLKADGPDAKPRVELCGKVSLRLRVWDFELPSQTAMLMTNWFFPDQVAEWYGLPMWSSAFWRLLGRFAEDMAEHRQNVILTPLLGGARPEDQMVGVSRRGRRYTFDFTRLDRWCRLFFKRGFRLIEGQHVAGGCRSGTPFWVTGSGGSAKRMALTADDPRFRSFLTDFMRALWQHLAERGWQGRYVQHISDEPSPADLPAYQRLAGIVRQAAPGLKLIDAIAHSEFADVIDHPVPLEDRYQRLLDDSGRSPDDVWVYYCCGPTGRWPNRPLAQPVLGLLADPAADHHVALLRQGHPGLPALGIQLLARDAQTRAQPLGRLDDAPPSSRRPDDGLSPARRGHGRGRRDRVDPLGGHARGDGGLRVFAAHPRAGGSRSVRSTSHS